MKIDQYATGHNLPSDDTLLKYKKEQLINLLRKSLHNYTALRISYKELEEKYNELKQNQRDYENAFAMAIIESISKTIKEVRNSEQ